MGPGSRGCSFARTLVQSMVTVATADHLTFHQFAVIIQRLRALVLFRLVIKASRQLQQPPKSLKRRRLNKVEQA